MKTKLMPLTVIVLISLTSCFFGWTSSAYANLLTGPINGISESSNYQWGDGINDLTEYWSARHETGGDGWFYGTGRGGLINVNIFVSKAPTDLSKINDASVFTYDTAAGGVIAEQGDIVFFKGTNGYYGAWVIDSIYSSGLNRVPWTYLSGEWYFQSDGTGNFSSVPIPGAAGLLGSGLLGLMGLGRKLRKY